MRLTWMPLVAALVTCACNQPIAAAPGYTITTLETDGRDVSSSPGSLVLFGPGENRLRGWSHIVTNPERFPHARFEPGTYAVDEQCVKLSDGARFFRTVLIKKLGDWNQQHVNGIEPLFEDAGLMVGEATSIVLEIRIDSARSHIPSVDEIAAAYQPWLDASQLDALDNGCAHLGVSIFEPGFNDRDHPFFAGTVFVEFEPARHFDRWLRVTIPIETMDFYFEKNYAHTPADRVACLGRRIVGLRINPETRTRLVARNFLLERFSPAVPERYKEIALEIRRLEIVRAR